MKFLVFFGVLVMSLTGNVRGDVSSDIQASFTDVDGMASATESDQFETEVFEQATEMPPYIEATATQEAGEATPAVTTPEMPSDFKRTVILIHKATAFGENLFVRGGIDHNQREGCGDMDDLDHDPCSIPIRERILDINGPVDARDAWASGDDHLDWYGPEKGQGTFNGVAAQGTPAQWTTNDPNNDYYSSLNTFGPNYWLVDVDMDCSKTEDNFFEFKAVLNNQFEPTNSQLDVRCSGDEARDLPYHADNHFGLCGFINVVFEYGEGACEIVDFH